jgi:hypothetical protein
MIGSSAMVCRGAKSRAFTISFHLALSVTPVPLRLLFEIVDIIARSRALLLRLRSQFIHTEEISRTVRHFSKLG